MPKLLFICDNAVLTYRAFRVHRCVLPVKMFSRCLSFPVPFHQMHVTQFHTSIAHTIVFLLFSIVSLSTFKWEKILSDVTL